MADVLDDARQVLQEHTILAQNLTPPEVERFHDQPSLPVAALDLLAARPRALPCLKALPCFFQPWCVTTKTTYEKPDIRPKVFPVKVEKVTFRPFKGQMDGTIHTGFHNESVEGKKTTTTTRQCNGGETTHKTEPVAGSADLTSQNTHSHAWDELQGVLMDKFQHAFSRVKPTVTRTTKGSFKRYGIAPILKAATELLLSWLRTRNPRIRVSATIDSQVQYTWLGKTNTQTWRFQTPSIALPVDEVNVDWSLW
jgi:hypothetical protein